MSPNLITISRQMYGEYCFFDIFGHWTITRQVCDRLFEISGRRDVVKNFETGVVCCKLNNKQLAFEFYLAHLLFIRSITGNQ